MIKAIIFDWGGVLIDNPTDGLINYCADSLGIKSEILKNSFSQYESEFQKGLLSEDSLWELICNGLKISQPSSKSLWKEAVIKVFKNKEEIHQLVQNLKKNGYKIGFLSNTEIPAMEYFFDKGYDKFFDETVFSCKEYTIKPEEEIYNIVLNKLQTKPDETIFIDDKPEFIEGAKKVGIHGVLFKNYAQLEEQLREYDIKID